MACGPMPGRDAGEDTWRSAAAGDLAPNVSGSSATGRARPKRDQRSGRCPFDSGERGRSARRRVMPPVGRIGGLDERPGCRKVERQKHGTDGCRRRRSDSQMRRAIRAMLQAVDQRGRRRRLWNFRVRHADESEAESTADLDPHATRPGLDGMRDRGRDGDPQEGKCCHPCPNPSIGPRPLHGAILGWDAAGAALPVPVRPPQVGWGHALPPSVAKARTTRRHRSTRRSARRTAMYPMLRRPSRRLTGTDDFGQIRGSILKTTSMARRSGAATRPSQDLEPCR